MKHQLIRFEGPCAYGCCHCEATFFGTWDNFSGDPDATPLKGDCPGAPPSFTPAEARAILAYIESLEKPWGLDMWRRYGLGADQASLNQAALFTQQHPAVGAALKKLQDVGGKGEA